MATAKKVKVRFLESRTVRDEHAEHFAAGQTYDLPPDSAEHWISRGVAELAHAEPDKKPPQTAVEDK